MEQVVFDEQAVADRIKLIASTYDDLVRAKERLESIVINVSSRPDYYSAVSSCTVFTTQYAATAESIAKLFMTAQLSLDAVIEVFRDTVATMYASNASIAEDFAVIDKFQLLPELRGVSDPWKSTRV